MRVPCLAAALLLACASNGADGPDGGERADGGGDGADAGWDAFTDRCAPTACGAATDIADAAAFSAAADTQPWYWLGPYTSRCVGASGDLHVAGSVTVTGASLPVEQACLDRGDCRHEAGFSIGSGTAGVVCDEWEPSGGMSPGRCRKVTLSATTVRLRRTLVDTHPSEYNFVPVIELLPPCAEPCPAGQLACPNHVCWTSEQTFCRLCLAGDKKRCACFRVDGPAEDDTNCTFMVSGDAVCQGRCRQGACVPDGAAGVCR